jgi:hypothetical protein
VRGERRGFFDDEAHDYSDAEENDAGGRADPNDDDGAN